MILSVTLPSGCLPCCALCPDIEAIEMVLSGLDLLSCSYTTVAGKSGQFTSIAINATHDLTQTSTDPLAWGVGVAGEVEIREPPEDGGELIYSGPASVVLQLLCVDGVFSLLVSAEADDESFSVPLGNFSAVQGAFLPGTCGVVGSGTISW